MRISWLATLILAVSVVATGPVQATDPGRGGSSSPPETGCVPRQAILLMPAPGSLLLPDILRVHTAHVKGCGYIRGVAVFADADPLTCGSLCHWVWVGVEIVR